MSPGRKIAMAVQWVGSITNDTDVYDPRNGHVNLDHRLAAADINDDYSVVS